ncbi:TolB family protein [Pseudoduganella sp. RAF53_2]|uniref:TolB family protein n=1 Tax=unclassified Pseudoduganella TaxID=2637179 RepID=UPI003F945700
MKPTAILVAALMCATQALAAPTIFEPGNISGPADDSDPAFTPDGNTLIFTRNGALLISHKRGNGWSQPEIAPFSGEWDDQQPAMAPDGSYLVFVSNRPATAGAPALAGGNLWRVDRKGDGWGQPHMLSEAVNRTASIWAPAIAANGNLYFIMRAVAGQPFRIWRAQPRGADYLAPEPVSLGDSTTQDVDPVIAPDESFIIYASRPAKGDAHERLYIAYRLGGGWSAPVDLGADVNGKGDTDVNEPRLSTDGHTLYFSTDRQLPRTTPRTRDSTARDLQRIHDWDNGRQNIWSIPLDPWLPKISSPR